MALTEFQKRELEEKRYAEIGRKIAGDPYLESSIAAQIGREKTRPGMDYGKPRLPEIQETDAGFRYLYPPLSGSTVHRPETHKEKFNRELQGTLAGFKEEERKKWEEARAAREATMARGPQQRKPDIKSLMSAEVAGDILPDLMPGDEFADMNAPPRADGPQATDPLANLRTKQGYMSMIDAMESGNIPEQTADRGGAAAQAKFDDTVDRVQFENDLENAMKKRPLVGRDDIARRGFFREQTPDLGRDSVQAGMSPTGERLFTQKPSETARQFQDKFRNKTVEGVGDIHRKKWAAEDEAIKSFNREQTPSLAPGEGAPQMTAPGGRGSEDSYDPGKWNKKFLEDNIKRQQSPELFDMDQSNQGEVPLETAPDPEAVDNFQRKFNVAEEAANIARQQKFDAQNKAERERLFAGLDKQEKALAKEATGKYWIEPVTGYAVNLESLKKHAKRQEIMDIAKHLPAATKVKFLRNEGILDDEDIPKDQKLTLEKEKIRVEIAKLKAQTEEIRNKNPQQKILADMADTAFKVGANEAGFELLEKAYGGTLPQSISKIFQSMKSKSSKKGGSDDFNYSGTPWDTAITGMPGKDAAKLFFSTTSDIAKELTAISINDMDDSVTGKGIALFKRYGYDPLELEPGPEYEAAVKDIINRETDLRLRRPGLSKMVDRMLQKEMNLEELAFDNAQKRHDNQQTSVDSVDETGTGMTREGQQIKQWLDEAEMHKKGEGPAISTIPVGMDDHDSLEPPAVVETTEPPETTETTEFEENWPRTHQAGKFLFDALDKGSVLDTPDIINEEGNINTSPGTFARLMGGQEVYKAIAKKMLELKADPEDNQAKFERIGQQIMKSLGIPVERLKTWLASPMNKEAYNQAIKTAIDEEKGVKTSPQAAGFVGSAQAATLDTLSEKQMTSGMKITAAYEDYNEGPYKDGGGWSIGHGFHLDKESIINADLQGSGVSDVVKKALLAGDHTNKNLKLTKAQSEKIFRNIYKRRQRETVTDYPWVKDLPEEAKNIIYDMAYNLGSTKFNKFDRFLNNMERGRYKQAAKEIRFVRGKGATETPYWKQTGNRAKENYEILMNL